MTREVTVTFDDGSNHVYQNVPDDVTPDQVEKRASKDFSGKKIKALDGGRKAQPAEPSLKAKVVSLAKDVGTTAAGHGEALASMAINTVAPAMAAGENLLTGKNKPGDYEKTRETWAYNPTNPVAKADLEALGNIPGVKQIGQVIDKVSDVISKHSGGVLSKQQTSDILNTALMAAGGKAAPKVVEGVEKLDSISTKAAETAQAARDAAKAADKEAADLVAQRQKTLSSLDRPIKGSKGQLTRDEDQLRKESLVAGSEHGEVLRGLHNEQNQALLDNLQILKGETGGKAISETEVGRSVQDNALRAKEAASRRNYQRLYKQAEETSPGAHVSAQPFVDMLQKNPEIQHLGFMDSWLKKAGITTDEEGATVGRLRLKELYDLRKKASGIARRGGTDGYYASEVVKAVDETMKQIPEGANAWSAANKAFRDHQIEFKEQGAVKALVKDKSATDRATALEDTWHKTVISGSLEDLQKVKKSLLEGGTDATRAAGRDAWNELKAQTVQYIIDKAAGKNVAKTETGARNVTAASFKNAIEAVGREKLTELLGETSTKKLYNISDAAEIVKTDPPASHRGSSTVPNMIAAKGIGFLLKMSGLKLVGDAMGVATKGVRDSRFAKDAASYGDRLRKNPMSAADYQ